MTYEHIALSASAGSGKTFTLSVRFIALLLGGAAICDVVALTFTKKAVGEMKERIEEVFCGLEGKKGELAALCELLECDEAEVLRRRDALLDDFLAAELKIYTFDSFFAQILRLFASYLGLRPDFELIENQEKSEWFLDSLSAEQGEEIAQILGEFNISLREFLSALEVIYSNYSGRFCEIASVPSSSLLELFGRLKTHLASSNKFIAKWLDGLVREEDFYKENALKLLSSPTSDKEAAKRPEFAQAREQLAHALVQNLRAKEANLLKLCFKYAQIYHAAAVKKHQEINLLSFADVAIYVHKILQNKELKDLFYFRLNSNLSHLLIDEFQDTSIIQYEIIRPLVEEIVAGIGLGDGPKSFFYVGDKKQSIYSFRGANQAVFDLFLAEEKFGIKLKNLGTNYRSYAEVVDFCNATFAPAYGDEFIPAKAAKGAGGSVRVFECESDEQSSFELVLASVRQLSGEICVLVRSNATAAALSEYLSAQGVSVASATARPLVSDLGVRVLLEYAKFCVFGDEAYGAFVASVLGHTPPRLQLELCRSGQKTLLYLAQKLGLKMSENLAEFIFSAKDELLENLYEESSALAASELNARVVVMTIHKSKGLQFENLICLHRATRGGADGGLKLVYDFAKSAWDGYIKHAAAARNLRAERDEDYAAKLAAAAAADAGDELNVVYVAYTRAVKNLVIIKEEKCELPVALTAQSEEQKAAWLAAGGVEAAETGGAETGAAADAAGVATGGAESGGEEATGGAEIADAAAKAAAYCFDAPIAAQKKPEKIYSEQLELGRAFHYFCELSDFSHASAADCLRLAYERFRAADGSALEQLANKLLGCGEFAELIAGKCLVKELAYMHDGRLGRVDLIAYDAREILIIDYKSSVFKRSYEAQLDRYEQALKSCKFAELVGLCADVAIKKYLLVYENERFVCREVRTGEAKSADGAAQPARKSARE